MLCKHLLHQKRRPKPPCRLLRSREPKYAVYFLSLSYVQLSKHRGSHLNARQENGRKKHHIHRRKKQSFLLNCLPSLFLRSPLGFFLQFTQSRRMKHSRSPCSSTDILVCFSVMLFSLPHISKSSFLILLFLV